MNQRIGNRLKGIREDRELTQTDIANILKIDQSYYAKYENGKHPIPIHHLKTLCEYYKVSANYILEISEANDRTKEEILEREKWMNSIPKEIVRKEYIKKEEVEKILSWAEYQGHIKGDIDIVLENIYEEE